MAEPKARQRRGGVRQRMAAAEAEMVENVDKSCLAEYLVEKYAWAEFTPQQVQALAMAGLQDMQQACPQVKCTPLEILANLGDGGRYPNKCHAEFLKHVEPNLMTPKPADISLPFKAPLGDRTQSLLLPHEMFASIYEHYPHAWTQNIIPDEETLGSFWDSMAAHPQMAGHPIAARPDFRSRCIPLGLHGDDVPITGLGKIWVSKMTQFSFFSMLALGRSTKDKMLWVHGIVEKLRISAGERSTLRTFFQLLAWSFLWLFRGVWPDRDWRGRVFLGFTKQILVYTAPYTQSL